MEMANSYVLIHGKNISHNTLAGSAVGPHMSIDKLFPALLECFGIILCGYIAGRADIIPESQAKGLGNFVSRFALPALLFKNMVLLDFGNVIWAFLWSVLVTKVTVFVLVCVLTLMVASPESRYSKAGLYAIFATQSNDFALGYPIVDALYRSTYPEYLQYIYLVAPVSLMLLNPIGFALCEVQRWKQASHPQHSTAGVLGVVVLQNPIVFMVIVGIISHFALGQRIPAVLLEFIDGLANSFGGAALFYLGLTMVGQLRKLTRDTGVALILLITAKLSPKLPHTSLSTQGRTMYSSRHCMCYSAPYSIFNIQPPQHVSLTSTKFERHPLHAPICLRLCMFNHSSVLIASTWLNTFTANARA
uniref:Integral membrane protein GPR155-like n=1 Tax=Acanthochromis polyacanthus TaxID=80966 RepID=A0A3Q1HEF1_9TELE